MAGSHRAARRPDPAAWVGLAVGAAVLAVYWTTLLPGVHAWDTAEAQTVLPLMGTMHPTGFPAFVVLGWVAGVVLQPFGDPAFRMNLFSAILVATAAGAMVPLLRRFGVPVPVAAAAGVGLALTPIAWRNSAMADAHSLHLAIVALIVLALGRWSRLVERRLAAPGEAAARRADRALVLAAALFGVALANHGLTILLVPAVGLYVLAVDASVLRRPRTVLAAVGACVGVAALFYLELPLRAGPFRAPIVYGHPDTWSGFWDIVLARQFQGDIGSLLGDLPGKAVGLASLTATQLGPLALLVPPAFVVTLIRFPRYGLLSGVATGVTVLFAASYLNANIGRYYLVPAMFAWTWLAIGAATVIDAILDRARGPREAGGDESPDDDPFDTPGPGRRTSVRTTLALLLAAALVVPTLVALPVRWREVSRAGDTELRAWLDAAMENLEPDAVVVSWWSYSTPLWYGTRVEGRRPDLLVVDDSNIVYDGLGSAEAVIDRYLGKRPVYVIRSTAADLKDLALRYDLEPVGSPPGIYRVTGTVETAP